MKNQHSHDQRQDQGGEAPRQSQPDALSPENRQFGGAQIAPVLPDSQNARGGEGLRTVLLVVGQVTKWNRPAGINRASSAQLSQ
jgi:hypothetical protein